VWFNFCHTAGDSRLKRILIAALGLLWAAGILVAYYAWHKPFGAELAAGLGLVVWRLLAGGFLLTWMGGLGAFLLRRSALPELHPLLLAALQAALGWGMTGLAVLVIGSSIGLARPLLWVLPLLGIILLRRDARAWLGNLSAFTQLWRESGRFERWVGGLLAVSLLAALLVALAPPTAYDALLYHLAMPDAYLRAGRVAYLPWLAMTGMPQTNEMVYTLGMAWGGLPLATLFGWSIGPLAALGLLGWLRYRFDARTAWAGLAALLAGPTLISALAWGYVDWPGLLFGLGCLALLDAWREHGAPALLFWSGIFAGLAFSGKYTAGNLALVAGGVLLWHVWRQRARLIPAGLRFAAGFALPALPWLIKNVLTTGNPFYPLFFPSGAMTALRQTVYQSGTAWGDWRDVLLLPLRATLSGIQGFEGYDFSVGPLLLGLGALAWLGYRSLDERQRSPFETAAAAALLGWAVWGLANLRSGYLIQTRMHLTIFPAFAALAGLGFRALAQTSIPAGKGGSVRIGRVLSGLVLFVLALNALQSGVNALQKGAPQVLLGIKSEGDYLADNLGWYVPAAQAARELPAGSRVLLLLEARRLYCAPVCQPDEILDRWKRAEAESGADAAAIRAAWVDEGFTHLLVSRAGLDFFRSTPDLHHSTAEMARLDAFLAMLPEPVRFGNAYELYLLEKP